MSRVVRRPLTEAQLNIWFHQQIDPTAAGYNIGQSIRFEGNLDLERLACAQQAVINRFDNLRCRFVVINDEPFQVIDENVIAPTQAWDVRGHEYPESVAKEIIRKEFKTVLDLEQDRLCRFGLIQIADDKWEWFWVMHHLVNDGWGCQIAIQYLAECYVNPTAASKPLTASWAQAVSDSSAYQGSDAYKKDQQYWQRILESFESGCSLARDPIPAHAPNIPASYSCLLSREQYDRIVATGHGLGATTFAVLAAIYAIYLSRITGSNDICLATPTLGRDKQARLAGGMMSNPVALRLAIQPNNTFGDIVRQVSSAMRGALRHSRYPAYAINQAQRVKMGGSPLDLTINLQSFALQLNFGTLRARLDNVQSGPVGESSLQILDNQDGEPVRVVLEYDATYLQSSDVIKHLGRLTALINSLPDINAAIPSIPIIEKAEEAFILTQLGGGIPDSGKHYACLPELFEQQVARTPEATALVFGDDTLTYAELDARANQLARHLIALGIGPEQIVALALPRSIEMVVSLLAVLKSGAAYLPLDPDYPTARLAFMLTDSGASLLITARDMIGEVISEVMREVTNGVAHTGTAQRIKIPILDLSNNLVQAELHKFDQFPVTQAERICALTPLNVAYLIYTSGSTGVPKGVGNTHLNVARLLEQTDSWFGFNPQDVWTLFHSIAFDFSVWEIWGALAYGGALVVVPDEIRRSPSDFLKLLQEQDVTVLNQTPAAFEALASHAVASNIPPDSLSLRYVIFGGAALNPLKLTEWDKRFVSPNPALINMYGITETTVHVTYKPLIEQDFQSDISPIGHAIPDLSSYVLDTALNPLPVGVVGELYIAGAGLARGYLGRAGLTAERFVANPFTPGARMYRSGDLARWTEDGVLEYLGRADAQVKIRGFRIELGEIEAALVAIPGIAQCTVQARGEDGAKQLVAYLVAAGNTEADESAGAPATIPQTSVIRNILSSTLPDYMVPAAFVVLESLPLTPNGKLDVRALPAPEITGASDYRAPVTEHEQLIAQLFTELTGATRVGLDDSFFALGGHSLLAMRLISQIRARTGLELVLRILFDQPTVEALAQALDQARTDAQQLASTGGTLSAHPPAIVAGQGVIDPQGDGTQRVLSYGQIRLWTLAQIEGVNGSYNMPAALRLSGPLKLQALEQALRDVINRHEPLRTVIVNVDGQPLGYVQALDAHAQVLALEDLRMQDELARPAALEQIIERDSTAPFDLSRDLMVRTRLITLSDTEHVLTLVMHHIAGDGVSIGVFCRELTQAYRARSQGQAPDWAPLSVSYADHAAWQRAWLEGSGELERQSQSWQAQLAGIPERLSLPTNYPRSATRSRAAGYLPIEISAQTTKALQNLADKHQTTLFTVLVAIYGTLLGRLANQSDVVIGSPVAGRTTSEADGLIGFFNNTIALRVDSSGHPDLSTLIERVKGSVKHALTHQDLPFERLVEDLGVPRSLAHTPVYQTSLSWQTQEATELSLDNLVIQTMPLGLEQAKSDLALYLTPTGNSQINGTVEYDASLFTENQIAGWMTRLVRAFDHAEILGALSTPVDSIPLLDELERHQVLDLFNNMSVPALFLGTFSTNSFTLPERFEQQVARTPETIALVCGDEELSYTELDERANQLARHLIAQGVGPEQIVAILLDRSTAMIVSMLAVLKAGAAYLPLDPSYPRERLSFMLADSGASVLISTSSILDDTEAEAPKTVRLDDYILEVMLEQYPSHTIAASERSAVINAQSLSYVIYTSGSTGTPKGAGNTHGGGSNLVDVVTASHKLQPGARVLQFASFSFDASFFEIMPALANGATLVLINEASVRSDAQALGRFIAEHQITHATLPPVILPEIATEDLATLDTLLVAGEACAPAVVKRHATHCNMLNGYGPTEASVCVTIAGPLDAQMDAAALVPIGRPVQNTQIYVLDASLNPLPVGVVGELYIAGAGLARGYLGRAGLTAERFVANPFTPGARMYRSGDLARWTEDGVLEYLGRADAQVKIRGFRIELGEIEAALVAIPGIAQCTVQARGEDGAKQLVAYLVAAGNTEADESAGAPATIPQTSVIRNILSSTLPDYMVPAAFVVLESLPLTPNGKLDVRALPAPEITGASDYRAPVTEHEQLIAQLFTELTGATRVGLDDSFFALGGDSISAIRLVSLARARNAHLTVRSIFEQPNVQALAAAIEVRHEQALILRPEAGAIPLTALQTQFLSLAGSVKQFNQAVALVVPEGGSVEQVRGLLSKLVAHHDALRLKLTDTPSGRGLWLQDQAPSLEIVEVDLSAQDAATQSASIAKLGQDLSKRLDPYAGQMIAATWVTRSREPRRTPDTRDLLLLAVHHLAIDGVSWRILFEDLEHLRTRDTLPARTHSVRDWAHALALQSSAREVELSAWCDTLQGAQALGADTPIAPEHNRMGDAQHHVSLLSQELASALGEVARTYHAGMDEVLLAALGLALSAWQHERYGLAPAALLVDLESHGRQSDSVSLNDSTAIDITHTVGWFTSVYPVRLDTSTLDLAEAFAAGDAAGLMLRSTKERIAKMPDKGLGFGILRYLNQKAASVLGALPQAQILFNYLGRFEQSQPQEGWYSSTFVGSDDDMDRVRMHEIDVNAAFDEQGRLQVVWSHHPLRHLPASIEDLAHRFEQALNALVRHSSQAPLAQRHTPSDFALALTRGLDQAMLDRWPQAAEVWPLTPMQQGLGFESLALADPTHDPYRVQLRMTLKGHLDSERLKRALEALLERHTILNLALPTEMLEKGLGIRHAQGVDFALIEADEQTLSARIQEDLHTPFDLEHGPLLRVRLIQTAPAVHHLILTNHHALLDGWSMPVVMGDLAALYRAETLPPTLAWSEHLKWLAAQDTEAAKAYWRNHLAGQDTGELWSAHRKLAHAAETQQDPGERLEHLPSELSEGLERFARSHDLTIANVIQSLYLLLLARLSNRNDITIGVTRSGRSAQRAGIDRAVGLYISTMPLRAQVDLSQPLVDWMRGVQTEAAQQEEHQYLGIQEIQKMLGQHTLFDSLFGYKNFPFDNSAQQFAPGLDITQVTGHDATNYGIALAAMLYADGLVLRITYDQKLFDAKQVQRIIEHLTRMVRTISTDAVNHLCLGDLQWFDEGEQYRVLELFNQTVVSLDNMSGSTSTLPELFEQQVARTPEAIALVCGDEQLSYTELDERANQLARHLIAQGAGPEQIVAILLDRSTAMIVSLLAVLKAGAAYLPLDPSYPRERLSFMLADSGASVLISTSSILDEAEVEAPKTVNLDDYILEVMLEQYPSHAVAASERLATLTSQNLAYLIYTSGSTGTPKGAGNTHLGGYNSVILSINQLKLGSASRALQFKSFAFDASFLEIMPVMCSGGALYLIDDAPTRQDPVALGKFIETHQIRHADIPPVMLPEIPLESLSSLQTLIVGGEASSADLVRRHASHSRMFNCYGPTEASVCVAYAGPLDAQMDAAALVPIGRPVQNTQIYVLDASLNPLPVGVVGELYIAGAGLARGYLGRAGLTAERFVANPFTPGARMYRSGDLARWTEDGVLEYLGRADAQVKIRGFRIELGEIEAALVAIPGIAQCTVQARGEDGAKQLVAYLVADAGAGVGSDESADAPATIPDASTLASLLSDTLPDYMVPAAFVVLESLPLTPNGKLDVRALPAPEITGASDYRAPVTEHEQLIAQLFTELTGATRVGLDDSFFALGGHSLLAMRLISQIRARTGLELVLRILFDQPTVEALAQALDQARTDAQQLASTGGTLSAHPPAIVAGQGVIDPQGDGTQRVLSYGQIRLWTLAQIEGVNGSYNMPAALRLSGPLKLQALEQALRDVINRHEPLRTVIVNVDGQPLGYVQALDAHAQVLALEDLRMQDELARPAALEQIIERDSTAPFDLSRDLMVRTRLITLSDTEHVLTLVMHHIAGDGVSIGVFCRELTQAYRARSQGQAPDWAPLSVSYADHAAWQRAWLEGSGELERQSQSWQAQLAGIPERLSLPTDYPIDANRSRASHHLPIEISAQTTEALQNLADKHQTTLFTVLVAIYGTLLGRLANQSDVVIGSPVAGRTTSEVDGLVGFFINTLALRVDSSAHPDLSTLIERVKGSVNHALTHQDLPFERLVEDLGVTRSLSHTPVFQAMLAWQTQEAASLSLGDLSLEMLPVALDQTKFDLTLSLAPDTDGAIRGVLEYDASLFTQSRIAQWVTWLVRSFEQIKTLGASAAAVDTLSLLNEQEYQQVVKLFNQTEVLYTDSSEGAYSNESSTLPELFERQVARTPSATALVFGDHTLTYAELDARANQLARHLISLGIGPDQIVALGLPRSIEMVVSLLAVLKSGAAYLPLDPDYPTARLAFMLTDSGASLLITQTGVMREILDAAQKSGNTIPVLELNNASTQAALATLNEAPVTQAERVSPLTPQNLSYLIYTSGSTGTPKGVGITEHNLTSCITSFKDLIAPGQTLLALTTFGFDIAGLELFVPLTRGASIALLSRERNQDPRQLVIDANKLLPHVIQATPSMWRALLEAGLNISTKCVIGGEASSAQLLKALAGLGEVINVYGPTETTIWSTSYVVQHGNEAPFIGRPLSNEQVYILDASLNPLPVGVAGELYIAGTGLARGYLGRAGLTAERFIANPFTPGARMYRSGDLARWAEDGVLEYLGRADAQVKIRGFRIELGEIEAALVSIPGIAQCTVQARGEDGAKQLVAYLVAGSGAVVGTGAQATIPGTSVIRSTLSSTLPDYMVPSAFVVLESLPLTPNGKLDVRALPAPEFTGEGKYRAPVTEHEQLIAALFTEFTGVTHVGLDDSFFTLGGHSLLAMRLLSQLRTRTGLELALRILFEQPTVAGVAQALDQVQAEVQALAASGAESVSRTPIVPGQGVVDPDADGTQRVLSYGQIRLWTLAQIEGASGNYNMPAALRLSGVLQSKALERALVDVIERHEPLRTVIANVDGAPVGYVLELDRQTPLLEQEDLSTQEDVTRTEALETIIARDSTTPFDLSRDLMIRARLIKLGENQHVLTLVMHHIAGDGVSMGVFCKELTQAYQARTQGALTKDQAPDWAPLTVSYADHAAWQRAWLEDSGELTHQSQSWQAQLAGIPERLSLPTDYPRDAHRSRAARYLPIEISAQTTAQLQALANRHQTTLFTVLIALYGTLLGRLANQSDVVIGSPVAGRTTPEVDGLIGFFINTLALRIDASGHPDLNTLMERAKGSVNHALTHQDLPFERLVEDLGVARSLSHTPVFQASLTWQTQETADLSLGDLTIESIPVGLEKAKSDLALYLTPTVQGHISGMMAYDVSLFTESRVAQWVTWFLCTLDQVEALGHIATPVDTVSLIDQTELQQVLELFNRTQALDGSLDTPSTAYTTLPELFEQQVARTPEAIALVCGDEQLSYTELDERANQLARHLIAQGAGPEQIVAILLDRSTAMIVSLLAALKAGAAYLPLDPSYPKERLSYMLGDSGASILVSTNSILDETEVEAPNTVRLDDYILEVMLEQYPSDTVTGAERLTTLTSQNLAYLIYTSGSTGKPKGAGNTHQGASNLVDALITAHGHKSNSRVLQFASFAFDASFSEIMPALAAGATLYLIDSPSVRIDPTAIGQFIAEHKITLATLPPVILPEIATGDLATLDTLVVAGEACAPAVVKRHATHCNMLNGYGPTEASVCVTIAGPLDAQMDAAALVPIGRPVQNTQIYVLDASLNPLPVGVVGELYIAGAGLARGYLGRAGLTAERFVANPFTPGARMYRSGDLARWTEDGVLEYLGRADAQVKIRGFRIELGEIEAALVAIPGIAQCTVQARGEDGAKQLVAYLVAAGNTEADESAGAPATIPQTSVIRNILSSTLPDYMVPAAFVVLESLPLTPNGKLDVRALPAPEITGASDYRAPVTEHEQLIAQLFTELTGATRVGLDDSFFALGGHSLLAMRLISQIRARTGLELVLRILFDQPTVEALAQALDQARTDAQQLASTGGTLSAHPPAIVAGQGVIDPQGDGTQRVLSYGQIRLWTLAQIEGVNGSYNMPAALRLSGPLKLQALEQALRDVINRHEPLRTVIVNVDGQPLGYVQALDAHAQVLALEDLRMQDELARPAALEQIIERDSTAPFDLSRDLMVRTRLITLSDTEHVLTLVMHHIAGDGVSIGVFCRELTQAYRARSQGQAPDWAPLSVSYADHAAWQRAWLEGSGELERQSQSWQAQLAGIPERLSLPTDYPRDANRSRAAHYLPIEIGAPTTRVLQRLANQHQTTLFTVLLAMYGTLLARLANQSDVVIGSPVAGRTTSEVDGLVGFFINTLALRIDASGHPDLNTLLERVKGSVNHALTHQDLPFERLVEDLGATRSLSHTPVFQAMLAWQTQQAPALSLGNLVIDSIPMALAQTKFDLTLSLAPDTDGAIRGVLEYDASLFTQSRIAQWVTWFVRILDQTQALSTVTTPIDTLSLLNEAERHHVLDLFNQTEVCLDALENLPAGSQSTTLPELFERQVARTPSATALVFGDHTLTYAELDARANQLARHLISLGIGPDQIVALGLPRSIEMVVSLLAVLKSGAAYLPLDPDYPTARLAFMLTDSGASLLITARDLIGEVISEVMREVTSDLAYVRSAQRTEIPVLDLSSNLVQTALANVDSLPVTQDQRMRALSPQNLAYLIYTSGSTGRPKGACITHSGLVNYLAWAHATYQPESGSGTAFNLSAAFDASVTQIYLPLLAGSALRLLEKGDEVQGLIALMQRERGLSFIKTTPAIFNILATTLTKDQLQSVTPVMVLGGEALDVRSCATWRTSAPDTRLLNEYGPTETVVGCAIYQAKESDQNSVPIGSPIWNTQIYVLDASLNPLPVGVVGELYIAGAGLARGYLGRAGLTAERFVANPFTPGARMYRSGDLARWTEDGVLEYLGRADAQVKIRGFRIELGEIEAALVAIPGIAQCTVQARGEDGAKQLVAYLVAAGNTEADESAGAPATIPQTSVIRNILSSTLPDYMVPAAFVVLESLPLTPNGKLDVRALPAPEITGASDYRAPVTEHEQLIAQLFTELTGATRVGLDDSFFALGGHSLLAMRLISLLKTRKGLEIALRTLFEYPTVTDFAAQLTNVPTQRSYQPLLPLNRAGTLPALFCFPPAGGTSTVYKNLSEELGKNHPLWGLQARGVDDDENWSDQSVVDAASTYVKAITAVQPSGPYYLMGVSLGGTIAHEAAVQLEARGDTVAKVFLLDTVVRYEQLEDTAKSENDMMLEHLKAGLRDMTDATEHDLPPDLDDLLSLFQQRWEELGMIPVGTPKAFVMRALKNSLGSSDLTKGHTPNRCQAEIIYFKATEVSDQNAPADELFNWQPYTERPLRAYDVPASHAQLLWKPESYKIIAKVVSETMSTDIQRIHALRHASRAPS